MVAYDKLFVSIKYRYNEDSSMETSNKSIHIERYIVRITAVIAAAGLFVGGWVLGSQRTADKYQAVIVDLQSINDQLVNEANTRNEDADPFVPVSAKAARDILFAAYPADTCMATLEYPFSDCAKFAYSQKIDDWVIPFTEKSFIMKWDGVITAGIDMANVSIAASKTGDKLVVTIPSAKVISFKIDEESFELLDERNNLFNPITLEDLLELDAEIEKQMTARAIDNIILTSALSNAKVKILDALRSDPSIGSYYEIEFKVK